MAHRKAAALIEAGGNVVIVSPRFCSPIKRMRGAVLRRRTYRRSDLRGAAVAIAATSEESVNRRVAADAGKAGIPVNVVDRPELCTFIVPASLRRGRLLITVSTEGASPAVSRLIRQKLGKEFGLEYARLLEALACARTAAMRQIRDSARRRKVLVGLASEEFLRYARSHSSAAIRRKALGFVQSQTGCVDARKRFPRRADGVKGGSR